MIRRRRASGVFSETEARSMHEAYATALAALELTHPITDMTKTLLADCIIRVLMTENIIDQNLELDSSILAARSIDRLLFLHNSELTGNPTTLH